MAEKKHAALPELSGTLCEPDPQDPAAGDLELDELWSFVLRRVSKRWVWIALSRATRQVVAYFIGDRSRESCRQLWARIPAAYQRGRCFTDFWEAYSSVIPAEQHTAAGKESGLTARVERWNNTLRGLMIFQMCRCFRLSGSSGCRGCHATALGILLRPAAARRRLGECRPRVPSRRVAGR